MSTKLYKSFFIFSFLFYFLVGCLVNTTNRSIIIIGKWIDENSVIEYFENGSWVGYWAEGEMSGTWSINNDTLNMNFAKAHSKPVIYKINEITDSTFIIQAFSDGKIFNKKKMN